ncbi:MAG: hypothetical protein V7607_3245 [Solirubrobacteraceae bacterium]
MAGRVPVIRSDGSPERDFVYVEDARQTAATTSRTVAWYREHPAALGSAG